MQISSDNEESSENMQISSENEGNGNNMQISSESEAYGNSIIYIHSTDTHHSRTVGSQLRSEYSSEKRIKPSVIHPVGDQPAPQRSMRAASTPVPQGATSTPAVPRQIAKLPQRKSTQLPTPSTSRRPSKPTVDGEQDGDGSVASGSPSTQMTQSEIISSAYRITTYVLIANKPLMRQGTLFGKGPSLVPSRSASKGNNPFSRNKASNK